MWGPGARGALPCPVPCCQELVGGERAQQCLQWGCCSPLGPSPCPFPIPTSRSHPPSAVSSPPVTLSAPFVPRCLISAPALGFWPCPSSRHCTHLMLRLLTARALQLSSTGAAPGKRCSSFVQLQLGNVFISPCSPGFIYTQIFIFSSSPAIELQVYIFNSGPEFPAPGLRSAPALHLSTQQVGTASAPCGFAHHALGSTSSSVFSACGICFHLVLACIHCSITSFGWVSLPP